MLISKGGLVQGSASEVQEDIVEPVSMAAPDRGEMPVNSLSRHSSFSGSGTLASIFPST